MTVTDLPIGSHLLEQLQAMPYDLDVNADGHITMTPRDWTGWTWAELCEERPFSEDFKRWRIETNAQSQIMLMPPPSIDHQEYEGEIIVLLSRLLPHGRAIPQCGVQTRDGTKEPDVVWASHTMRRAHRGEHSFSRPPELCVEVISPSNTVREINEKRHLYFEAGAQEVWLCGEDGEMTFYLTPESSAPCSALCPEFPARIDLFSV